MNFQAFKEKSQSRRRKPLPTVKELCNEAEKIMQKYEKYTPDEMKERIREEMLEKYGKKEEPRQCTGKFDVDAIRAKIAEHAERLAQEEETKTRELAKQLKQGVKEALIELANRCPHCGRNLEGEHL